MQRVLAVISLSVAFALSASAALSASERTPNGWRKVLIVPRLPSESDQGRPSESDQERPDLSKRRTQAVELLQRSMCRPVDKALYNESRTVFSRTTYSETYHGDDKTARYSHQWKERLHKIRIDTVQTKVDTVWQYEAKFAELSLPVEKRLGKGPAAIIFPQIGWLNVKCANNRACVSSRGASGTSKYNSLTIDFCDEPAIDDAKVALEELIRQANPE